jgi:hypothetical protein
LSLRVYFAEADSVTPCDAIAVEGAFFRSLPFYLTNSFTPRVVTKVVPQISKLFSDRRVEVILGGLRCSK